MTRQHRWHSQPIRHRRTAAIAASKAGRACACACDGRVQRQADSGRTGEAGCCAADVERMIGAAEAAEAACPTAQSGARCACVPCATVHTSGGREPRRVRVASRRVGLEDVLWHDFRQSPSRRPEQREQLQWPVRLHQSVGVRQLRRKRPAGGGSVPASTRAATDDATAAGLPPGSLDTRGWALCQWEPRPRRGQLIKLFPKSEIN